MSNQRAPLFYKLVDSKVVPIEEAEWLKWCSQTGGREYVIGSGSAVLSVDTVFLGADRQLYEGAPPLLFETLIHGGPHDRKAWLSSTMEEAERRHDEACELAGIERLGWRPRRR